MVTKCSPCVGSFAKATVLLENNDRSDCEANPLNNITLGSLPSRDLVNMSDCGGGMRLGGGEGRKITMVIA